MGDVMNDRLKMELMVLLTCVDDTTKFRKSLTLILLEWMEERTFYRSDDSAVIYRMHLLIDFFDKVEEIEKGK
jgi:hypothetical protein